MNREESLARYVRRVLKEKGLSYAEVEERSEGAISDSYIGNIVTGSVGSVTVAKLKALARGLDVSEDEIFGVARGTAAADLRDFRQSRFATLFDKYSSLPDDDQKEVLILLETVEHEIERRRLRRDFETRQPEQSLVA